MYYIVLSLNKFNYISINYISINKVNLIMP